MDNLLIFEDFSRRTPGESVRLNNMPVGASDEIGGFYLSAVTTDPRIWCREDTKVVSTALGTTIVGSQYFVADMSSVKAGSKLYTVARQDPGNISFYLAHEDEGTGNVTNLLIKDAANSSYQMIICTELGIVFLRNTVDTNQNQLIEDVSLTDQWRQWIRDRDFMIGIHINNVSANCWCFYISEVDLGGNGYPMSRISSSTFSDQCIRDTVVEGDLDADPESSVYVYNKYTKVDTEPFRKKEALHKIVAKDNSASIGKKLMLVEEDGSLTEADFRDTDDVNRHPQTVWFRRGSQILPKYQLKLVEVEDV